MMYSKLPVVMLMEMASSDQDSIQHQIARYLVEHHGELKGITIQKLADACHTGIASISRFTRAWGFESFTALKDCIAQADFFYSPPKEIKEPAAPESRASIAKPVRNRLQAIEASCQQALASVDISKIEELAKDLACYQKVAVFGLLKAESAALSLQCDLLMMHKLCDTSVSFEQQKTFLQNAGRDTLILLFSATGSYFEYVRGPLSANPQNKPKIWMISPKAQGVPAIADGWLSYHSDGDPSGHPYALLAIASLIADIYFEKIHSGQ